MTRAGMKTRTKARGQSRRGQWHGRQSRRGPKKLTELNVVNLKPKAGSLRDRRPRPAGTAPARIPIRREIVVLPLRSPISRTWTRLTLGPYPALGVKAARRQASKAAAQVAEQIRSGGGEEIPSSGAGHRPPPHRRERGDRVSERCERALSSQMAARGGARFQNGNRAALEEQADHPRHRTGRGRHSGEKSANGARPRWPTAL